MDAAVVEPILGLAVLGAVVGSDEESLGLAESADLDGDLAEWVVEGLAIKDGALAVAAAVEVPRLPHPVGEGDESLVFRLSLLGLRREESPLQGILGRSPKVVVKP